jgi:hypothetical protein
MYVVLSLCTMFTKYLFIQTSSSVILPGDLQTLESYSCRIRHIHLHSFPEKVSNHIYSSITRHIFNKNSGFFPALRCFAIRWFSNISEQNLLILPLIPPSFLSAIDIRNVKRANEIHLASFLSGIAHLHPSSSTFHPLSFLRLDGTLTMSTLAQLDYFKKLTTLELFLNGTDFPLVILSSLSKLPSLANFVLQMVLYSEWLILNAESSAKPMVYSFSNLQNLEVRTDASIALGILQSIYGERLQRVTLELGAYSITSLKACIKRCPEMAPHMLFYSIDISEPIGLPRDMFAPLPNSYGQLRSLTIESMAFTIQHFWDFFDRARASFSWSALEVLKLQVSDFQTNSLGVDEVVPLSSLSMLAASCPRLHTLGLDLYYPLDEEGDRETTVLTTYIQSSQPTDHKLTHLKIVFFDPFVTMPEPGDIMDAVTVSRFIDHIFPNVQNVEISDGFGVREEWCAGVQAMMRNYRDVRERKTAKESIIPN